jgi:hypothetical protein
METISQSGLLLWDRTTLKSVRSGPASLVPGIEVIIRTSGIVRFVEILGVGIAIKWVSMIV